MWAKMQPFEETPFSQPCCRGLTLVVPGWFDRSMPAAIPWTYFQTRPHTIIDGLWEWCSAPLCGHASRCACPIGRHRPRRMPTYARLTTGSRPPLQRTCRSMKSARNSNSNSPPTPQLLRLARHLEVEGDVDFITDDH